MGGCCSARRGGGGSQAGKCGYFDMEAQGVWHKNVTAKISGDTVVLSPPLDADGCAVVESGAAPTAVRCE